MRRDELIVVHGIDPAEMAYQAAAAARLESLVPEGAPVTFKPNLVVSKDASSGAVTHPGIVEGLVRYLREHGIERFEVIEGSWVGDSTARAFKAAGYEELSRRLGIPLFDLQADSWKRYDAGGGLKVAVCDRAMSARFLVNLPVLKGHCQTTLTCALKNLKGCIPDDEKSRFNSIGLFERMDARLGALHETRIAVGRDFSGRGDPVGPRLRAVRLRREVRRHSRLSARRSGCGRLPGGPGRRELVARRRGQSGFRRAEPHRPDT